jgi:TPR repeat protein
MGRAVMRRVRLVLLLLAVPLLAAAAEPPAEKRIALVIGNTGYRHVGRLGNPENDAKLVATTLLRLGFTLVGGGVQTDLDKSRFDQTLQQFGQAIQGAEVALFYYAGHGMQVQGTNWLVPIDANPARPQDLDFQLVNADLVLKQMDGAGTRLNIAIFDACRNNPFAALGTRAAAGGLAEMRAPEGTLISFATQPGNVAADGTGADGPFALALAEAMRRPGLDIFHVFNQVGLAVKRSTGGSQQPWVSASPIDGDFYFNHTEASQEATATPVADPLPAPTPEPEPAQRSAGAQPLEQMRSFAEQGRPDAQTDLGLAYWYGRLVERDRTEAARLFGLAAAQGYARAEYIVGVMQERGLGGVTRSYAAAFAWYSKAAEQNYPRAQVALGRLYANGLGVGRDPAQSTLWYRRAAEQNFPAGQYGLGMAYGRGLGVAKDPQAAAQWVRRAALQGYRHAELRLGLFYVHGFGVPKDFGEARQWIHLAAERGDLAALNDFGVLCRDGLGAPRDYAEAARWFRQAAEQGYTLAALNLGTLYAQGLGVPRDREQAATWLRKAADAGNDTAAARLRELKPAGP